MLIWWVAELNPKDETSMVESLVLIITVNHCQVTLMP